MDAAPVRTTVVIPVWGHYAGAPLDEALASIREQDRPVRIVVVDNASGVSLPGSQAVEIVHSQARLALGAARNLGLAHVRTPYVVVWDADDVMLPATLARLEHELDSVPDLAAFAAAIVEESGARHRWPRRWVGRMSRWPGAFSLLHCVWSQVPSTGSTIMRTDLLRAGGGYSDAESGDDWVAGVSLVFRGRIGWTERPGRVYRMHDESVWARHMSARHQVGHARAVRDRIRTDSAAPEWARRMLPVIAVAQYAAIATHVVLAAGRRAGRSRRGGTR